MLIAASLFLVAAVTVLWTAYPWLLPVMLAPCALLCLLWRRRWMNPVAWLLCGALWCAGQVILTRGAWLPESVTGRPVAVEGVITEMPTRQDNRLRFLFETTSIDGRASQRRLRLSWYHADQSPRAGERWRLIVKLKSPRGWANPDVFDYEAWLFAQRIAGTGYIREDGRNQRLAVAPWWSVDSLRERIRSRLRQAIAAPESRALVQGLALGDRSDLSPEQWRILAATGTGHLLAISGLHVAVVAGGVAWLLRRIPGFRRRPWDRVTAGAALLAATGYALLAGFGLPTRRALVMLSVATLALALRRRVRGVDVFGLALWAVLISEPLAPMHNGFWLSFGAVAAIGAATACRAGPQHRGRVLGRAQIAVFTGLTPLVALEFHTVPWLSPIINLVMVPAFSLAVIPVTLCSVILVALQIPYADLLVQVSAAIVAFLWAPLHWIAEWSYGVWHVGASSPARWLAMLLASLLLLAPRGLPGRSLWPALALAAIFAGESRPGHGEFTATVLDVGHGLAVTVQTRRHWLLYDAGDRYPGGLDLGAAVVAPFLRARRSRRLDALVISHDDRDHRGGAVAVQRSLDTVTTLTGASPQRFDWPVMRCLAGQSWTWDGIQFDVLHPAAGEQWSDNDGSCLLRISSAAGTLLLTGDLQADAERHLVESHAAIASDVVLAGHHGSATSSTAGWIESTGARHVVVSAAYSNRWGLPDSAVTARWHAAGATVWNTADDGAVTAIFRSGVPPELHGWRDRSNRAWRAP